MKTLALVHKHTERSHSKVRCRGCDMLVFVPVSPGSRIALTCRVITGEPRPMVDNCCAFHDWTYAKTRRKSVELGHISQRNHGRR